MVKQAVFTGDITTYKEYQELMAQLKAEKDRADAAEKSAQNARKENAYFKELVKSAEAQTHKDTEKREEAESRYESRRSLNSRYRALLSDDKEEEAECLYLEAREAEDEALRRFKCAQDELVRIDWYGNVHYPHEILLQNIRLIGGAIANLKEQNLSSALRKLYQVDNNAYAFNFDEEVKDEKKIAEALKKSGWEFASHTWGHKDVAATSLDDLKRDDKKWKKYVAPILGETDMIIFAFGADIGSWEGYSADNEKYEFYKSQGYRYFCNVDSSQYFVQITDDYFRQGRRNLDGYRMYYNPEMLSDLFDVSEVWDSSRPTPVPGM